MNPEILKELQEMLQRYRSENRRLQVENERLKKKEDDNTKWLKKQRDFLDNVCKDFSDNEDEKIKKKMILNNNKYDQKNNN